MSAKTAGMALYGKDVVTLLKNLGKPFTRKWNTTQMSKAVHRLSVAEVAPDGEIAVPPSDHYGYYDGPLWSRPDAEIRKWLAIHLKLVVKDLHKWYRANDDVVDCLSDGTFRVTVSDVYLIYDAWLGRKNLDMKYSKSQLERWVGKKRDPITTELEIARRQEIKEIKENLSKALASSREEQSRKVCEFREKLEAEYDVKREALKKEAEQEIAEIEKQGAELNGLTETEASACPMTLAS